MASLAEQTAAAVTAAVVPSVTVPVPAYAELHCLTSFSFLRAASQPEELIERAAALGYRALAVTDECSVAGVVRAYAAWRALPDVIRERFSLIIGSECRLQCGMCLVILATDRKGYGQLCQLITRGRRAAEKGTYRLSREDVLQCVQPHHCLLLWLPERVSSGISAITLECANWLQQHFQGAAWIAVELLRDGLESQQLADLGALAALSGLPQVAAGGVCMHRRTRRRLHDALTAIRLSQPIHALGRRSFANGERYLREPQRLARLYPQALLAETIKIAQRCQFNLKELCYEYPKEIVPEGYTASEWLRKLVEAGARKRWGERVPAYVRALIEHELQLIAELGYESYFLTVEDIVAFARKRDILCQGRGSAANSAVCYCLGITEVDPARMSMLFERFISRERNEPPDIDVDFEHDRREEVIQYIYRKYGRHRAALTATVIRYRPRSVLRDLGKAMGFSLSEVEQLAKAVSHWDRQIDPDKLREAGFDVSDTRDPQRARQVAAVLELAPQLLGFPRHLSQHVGGFVIARDELASLVPIENASMPERTVIQWDKDDLDVLGLLKVDVLALGMLSAIRKTLQLLAPWRKAQGQSALTLADIPAEDPQIYDMLCRGDSVGVFQVESRAQMAMLPRLRPRNFYDLVIEVAIVRPGPIQGDMVHPYLRRRNGEEPVTYPSEAVADVLKRTLGVPIFQEQVMQLAVVAAGFTPGEADALRRAMAAWKRQGGLGHFGERLIRGMRERGYTEDFAQRIFEQIKGFGEYGFPESHAASFALLVYVSAWLKCHEPAAFTAALLNSQPMGFYAPAQLIRDARQHGVPIEPVDLIHSDWDCTLEPPAIRLGLRMVRGLSQAPVMRWIQMRQTLNEISPENIFGVLQQLGFDRGDLEALAAAGALKGLSGHRHRAFWQVAGVEKDLPLAPASPEVAIALLKAPTEGEDVVADYRHLGLTLGRHPIALLRSRLDTLAVVPATALAQRPSGARVSVAGLVTARQKPATAGGVTFVTLEDDTGYINLIIWRELSQRYRRALLGARLMQVEGRLQRQSGVTHVVVSQVRDLSVWLGQLLTRSRDFH
jgi:error-prone DNA polymerase